MLVLNYFKDMNAACEFAAKQSFTTHQGDEAAECCRLLTFVCVKAIELGTFFFLLKSPCVIILQLFWVHFFSQIYLYLNLAVVLF